MALGAVVGAGLVGYALSAVTSFLIFASGTRDGAQAVLLWLLGSLAVIPAAVLVVVATIVILVL